MFTSSWIVSMTSKTLRTLEELNTSLAKKKCQYSYQLVFLKLKAISSSHAFFHMFLYLKNEKCLFQTEFINDMYGIYRIASVILKLKFLYISEQSSFFILRFFTAIRNKNSIWRYSLYPKCLFTQDTIGIFIYGYLDILKPA